MVNHPRRFSLVPNPINASSWLLLDNDTNRFGVVPELELRNGLRVVAHNRKHPSDRGFDAWLQRPEDDRDLERCMCSFGPTHWRVRRHQRRTIQLRAERR
jgi:hypothetical protein